MVYRILTLLFFFLISAGVYAQTDTAEVNDTMDVEDWDSWEDWEDFEFEVDELTDEFRGSPTIYLSYGFAKISRKDMGTDFIEPRSFQLKLGKTYQKDYKRDSSLLDYRLNYIFLDNITTEAVPDEAGKLQSETWRFGLGRGTGYGYKLGEAAIIPYSANSFTWSRLDASDYITGTSIDSGTVTVVDRYHDAFRFANTTEAGIKFQLIPNLALEPSFERTIVYERHLFWKWGGSILIEIVAQSLLDEFIKEIIDSSPSAGPVVNFVLKNALSYGMYELRKEKMNWPFPSAPGLLYDQFKIGLTFTF